MNKTYVASIAIAFASLAAGQAMAANVSYDPLTGVGIEAFRQAMSTPSSVTREQVKADLFAYRAAHKNDVIESTSGLNISELRNAMAQPIVKTRAQVREEAVQALRNPAPRAYWENIAI